MAVADGGVGAAPVGVQPGHGRGGRERPGAAHGAPDHLGAPGAEALLLADGGSGLRRLFAASGHTGNVEPYVSAMLEPEALDRALSWFRADPPAGVPDVTVPTLLVWGEEDPLLSPDRLVPLLLAHLRSAT